MAEVGHDGAVPATMSELVLTLFDGETGAARDGHRRAGVLADELQLTPGQRVNGRRQEQVRLRAQRVSRHHPTRVRQIPARPTNTYLLTYLLRSLCSTDTAHAM